MAQYDAEQENLTIDKDRKCQLTLSCMPVSLSFTLFDDAVLLVDPTHEEETVCQGQITVITSGGDSICSE
ncbi:hypothetical protein EB796_024737 [Bugula neritina]|uniref:Exoribonuclease phosphorolytic domain-containing protein n=1 Tax=Bugula neritina TaxID=10212 RepID=A0A7J7IUQ1_BUGNE|nr:hypothetical protein EB796_024737 [Bugula neritina]